MNMSLEKKVKERQWEGHQSCKVKLPVDYKTYILEILQKNNGYKVCTSTTQNSDYDMDVEILFSFMELTQAITLARLEGFLWW